MTLATQIIQLCVVPLLGVLVKFLVDFLSAKRNELKAKTDNEIAQKYIDMIYETIASCVTATNQTYVESLKKDGAFTKEAQEEAFKRTMDSVLTILTQDALDYIVNMTGDLNTYLTQLIEAEVNRQK